MFDENNAKQLILRILQIPIPNQVSDQSLKFVILFFQNKKKVISSKTSKLLESISPFSDFMQEIFGDDIRQGNCFFPWTSLTIIDLKLKPRILSENDIKAASLFVFYAALDWLTLFEFKNTENSKILNQNYSPLLPDTSLLDSILTVSSMCKPFVQFSLGLFCLIFTRITSIVPSASVKALEGSACKFLSSVTSTDSQALHLVEWAKLINQEFEKNNPKSEQRIMPQSLRTVLELVMQAIQIVPNYFSNEDAHEIFNILKSFALDSSIDPFMLNLAALLSPFLSTEETDQIFQSGVFALMTHILSNQPFVNFSGLKIQFNSQDSKQVSSENIDNNQEQNENEQNEQTQNKNEPLDNEKEENLKQNENDQKNESETKRYSNDKINTVINSSHLFNERGKLSEFHFFIGQSDFSSSHEIIEKMPDDIKSYSCLLKQMLEYSSHLNCELFPQQIESALSKFNGNPTADCLWSILLVLLFLCENSKFEEQSLCEFFSYLISNTSLFQSSYTIFQSQESVSDAEKCNLELFLRIRFYAIRIFISPSQISCFQLYWKYVSSKVFLNNFRIKDDCAKFAEFFVFMESIQFSSLILSVLPICISDTYFATLNADDSSIISSAVCGLINSVFLKENKSKELINEFFMNDSFLNFLFAAIFDSFFTDIAMRIISHCFTKFCEKIMPFVSDAFKATQNNVNVSFFIENQEEASHHLSVLCKLIEMVIELVMHHTEKALLCSHLFQSSYCSLKNLSSLCNDVINMKKEIKEELHISLCNLLHSFIKFSARVSSDENDDLSWTSRKISNTTSSVQSQSAVKMTQTFLDDILAMIQSIEGSEPSTPCFSSLIFAVSTGKSYSLRAEFLISRPSFLALTMRAFSSSSRLSGLLRFVGSLCDFSNANCRACHVGGLDVELVKILHKNCLSAAVVKDAFHLIGQIAQAASSTAAVSSYMTCFHCIEEPYKLSPLTEPALSSLDQILARGSQTPAAFLPVMNELPCIRIDGLTDGDLYNGFTIVAWIFIDGGSQDSPASLISIGRDESQQVHTSLLTVIVQLGRVFISNGRFLGGKDAIVLEDSVPTDRWTMVAVTFENDKNNGQRTKGVEFRIKSFISNKTAAASQRIPIELGQSRSRPLTVTSCGTVEGGSGLEHPALLASVTLFPALKSHECLEIAQNGLLLTRSNTEGSAVSLEAAKKLPAPIFCSVLESENSVLRVSSAILKKPKISKVSLVGRPVVQQMPFADVFTRFFTAKSLIPVLALLTLPSSTNCEGQKKQSISSFTVSVLFKTLQMSPAASRNEFVASGGFKIVSFLLSNVPECLTPDLFIQFAAFARESSSNEVKTSTADEIVFNERLWCLANEKTQLFVVQQWINLAYEAQKGNKNSLQPARTLSSFLPPTILFFWANKNAENCSSDLRTLVMNSIIVRAGTNLSAEDVNALISAALSSDQKICLDVLYIMKQVALMPNSFSSFSDADFFPLNQLFSRNSFSVICSLVRFIIAIHSSRVECRFTLGDHLTMVANEIAFSDKQFTAEDAAQLADLSDSHPETFPVCCAAIAATIESKQLSDSSRQSSSLDSIFSSVMRTQRNLEVIKDWAFWPIYASLRCGSQSMSSAAKFVLKNSIDLNELFGQAVVASVTAGDESGSACREVLLQAGIELLLNRIGGKKQSQNVRPKLSEDTYVGLCFYFIFYYGSNSALTSCLNNEGIESGFVDPTEKKEASIGLKKSPFKFFACSSSEKASFNIDADSNWRDKELALQCVQVIVKRKIVKYANLALFLLSYLLKTLPEPSATLLQEVKTMAAFEEPFLDLLMLMIKQNVHSCPPDRTIAFESLIGQFFTQTSIVQSSINACSTRLNRLFQRFKKEENQRPSPLPFNSEPVEAELKEEQRSARHLWRSLWRQMTFDCAPWNGSLSGSPAARRWKRDETLCTSSLIPMKMKVNYKFNDHNEASLGRELGNLKLAREQNEETKRQRRQASLCPELLETGSFEDEEETKTKEENSSFENDESQSQSRSNGKAIKKSPLSDYQSKGRNLSHGLGFDTATRFFRPEVSLVPLFSSSCRRVRVPRTRECMFNLFSDFIGLQFKSKSVTIQIRDITRVFLRDPLHHPCGIEIFTRQGISYFLVFPEEIKNTDVTSLIARQVSSPQLRSFIQTVKSADFFANHGITQLWCQRKMSNFEYLMQLNHFSGRSFCQLSMYPFLPWILVDYESDRLNLNDSSSFRDLSKPVGKLGLKRLESLRKRAKEMLEFGNEPFLYSSYAVSPLIVILWMMRVEPFTTLHIEMQSGKFDHAARQFASVPDTFRMVNTHLNDFRELIPEFFFSKAFLVNENKFDLGFANENKIDDVILPPWASKSALAFVYINRKALESDHVSDHLNEWIDLIWGFKQRGKEAEEADNTYDPSIYSDVWTEEALNDQEKRSLVDQTMTHCGQIPDQLFTAPHPKRQASLGQEMHRNTRCLSLNQPLNLEGDTVLFGTSRELRDSAPGSQKFELVILRSSGKLSDVFVATSSSETDLHLVSSQPLMKGIPLDVEEMTSFAMFSLDEIAFGTSSGRVAIIDTKQGFICSHQPHSGLVNCVSASSPFVVSGGADTVISCSEKVGIDKVQRIHSMPAYSSEVVCAAVSRDFHVVVSGTRGGLLIVQSLEKSAVTCVIELRDGRKPTHVAVTRSWGFIVVFTQKEAAVPVHEVHVFTLCGEFIGSTMTEARVSKFLTWTSEDGFDFVAAALSDGRIVAFEAFFVSAGFVIVADSNDTKSGLDKGFGCEEDEVVLMSYSIESGTFVAVTRKGRISLICDFFIRTDQILKLK